MWPLLCFQCENISVKKSNDPMLSKNVLFSSLWYQSLSRYHTENSEERARSSSRRGEERRQILLPEMCGAQFGTGESSWLFTAFYFLWLVVFHGADRRGETMQTV